jgi:hypothetical protein
MMSEALLLTDIPLSGVANSLTPGELLCPSRINLFKNLYPHLWVLIKRENTSPSRQGFISVSIEASRPEQGVGLHT